MNNKFESESKPTRARLFPLPLPLSASSSMHVNDSSADGRLPTRPARSPLPPFPLRLVLTFGLWQLRVEVTVRFPRIFVYYAAISENVASFGLSFPSSKSIALLRI